DQVVAAGTSDVDHRPIRDVSDDLEVTDALKLLQGLFEAQLANTKVVGEVFDGRSAAVGFAHSAHDLCLEPLQLPRFLRRAAGAKCRRCFRRSDRTDAVPPD